MRTQQVASLLTLPDECRQHILQQLGTDQRSICSAARAHSRLHQAACRALHHLSTFLAVLDDPHRRSVLLYLSNPSQQVSSMTLQCRPEPTYRLDSLPRCDALQRLSITEGYLQLFPAQAAQGLLLAVPNLTQLSLCECLCKDDVDDLDEAAAAATIAETVVAAAAVFNSAAAAAAAAANPPPPAAAAGARGGALAAPTADVLQFLAAAPNEPALAAVKVFAQLQQFSVTWQQWQHCPLDLLQADILNHLTYVTQLSFCGPVWAEHPSAAAMSKIACLTALQELKVTPRRLSEDDSLSDLQRLTRLELGAQQGAHDVVLILEYGVEDNPFPLQLRQLTLSNVQAEGQRLQLLQHIGLLQSLTRLELDTVSWGGEALAIASYSALTASSCLEHLELHNCQLQIPEAGWNYVFDPARPRPALRVLVPAGSLHDGDAPERCSSVDLARLVSCCPELRQLDLTDVPRERIMQKGSALTQLSSLTSLSVSVADEQTVRHVLAKLTQCTALQLSTTA